MKIRADFVTNSSSTSYVDVHVDNPYLKGLIEKYKMTDFCSLDEVESGDGTIDVWEVKDFAECLTYLNRASTPSFTQILEENKEKTISEFRFARINMGYCDTECGTSGEESSACLSPREEDDDWEKLRNEEREPTSKTANFVDAKPEDLWKRTELSETMKLIRDHLSTDPIKLVNKQLLFIGS